jgi:hypothetical protein
MPSKGFEPPTPRSVIWCSVQLSYEGVRMDTREERPHGFASNPSSGRSTIRTYVVLSDRWVTVTRNWPLCHTTIECGRPDSNRRPLRWQRSIHPPELLPHKRGAALNPSSLRSWSSQHQSAETVGLDPTRPFRGHPFSRRGRCNYALRFQSLSGGTRTPGISCSQSRRHGH